MPRIALVTGASGFIGRHVCRTLAAQGVEVLGLGHGAWSGDEASAWGVSRWIQAGIEFESLARAIGQAGPDAVIHCAGSASVAYSYASPHGDYLRSVASVATLLEHVRTACGNQPRIVLASSAAVYGDQGDVDLVESAACSPISPYGFNKYAAERMCNSYSRFFATGISIVRLFSVYGEGLRKQLLWDAANKFRSGDARFFGTGHEVRDWLHVDDAACLLCAAALRPQARFEIFNGGGDKATTSAVLAGLSRRLGSGSPPMFTGETHTGNPRRMTADSSHAKHQLGWSPAVGIDAGLDRYAVWFQTLAAG